MVTTGQLSCPGGYIGSLCVRWTAAVSQPIHEPDSEDACAVFADYLAMIEQGEPAEIDAFCAEHPEYEEELRKMHAGLEALHGATQESPASLFQAREGGPRMRSGNQGLEEGRTLGDFRLMRCIGRGGMGEVWEAEQISLARRVALKVLLPDRVDPRALEFFAREARAGGKLSHPGIVAVYGTGETEGVNWIAMELVAENCDLHHSLERLRESEELGVEYYALVALFVAELAGALEAAHTRGVIHRDLKPGNVLVTPEGHPKLTDFGLAKLVHEQSLSLVGEVAGTYFYMSPEQVALKHAGIDHRSDIFSLGVVLYEMLTLVRPFQGDTGEQVVSKILWNDPPSPRELRSKVPEDLAVICGKAMEKDRDQRYPTMAEVAADLRRHLAHEPIHARPPTVLQKAIKWVNRNPTKSAVALVALAAMVVITVFWQRARLAEREVTLALGQIQKEQEATQVALVDAREQRDRAQKAESETRQALADLGVQKAAVETQRDRADENAALADAERERAEQRAMELEQVSEFQSEQLMGVDAAAMGRTIIEMVLEQARAAGLAAGQETQVLDRDLVLLRRLLSGADFTGLALEVLDKEIFERALNEIKDLLSSR